MEPPTLPIPFAKLLKIVAIDEVQGVFQERVDGRIKFFTYVVRE